MAHISNNKHKATLAKYRKLYRLAQPTMQPGDGPKLKEAFRFALTTGTKSIGALRIIPPLEVAEIVAELGAGIVPIICALLYNPSKGTVTTPPPKILDDEVAQKLEKLAQLDALLQANETTSPPTTKHLVVAWEEDPQLLLLQLANNLQKMRTLSYLLPEQRTGTLAEAKYIYIPIAHRLGFNAIKAELEDLHLELTEPADYYAIAAKIKETKAARAAFIKRFKRSIQATLKEKGFIFTIKGRLKSVSSIRNKMKALGVPFEKVYDRFAIRIILDTPLAQEKLSCWQIYEVVTNIYRAHPDKFRNWLSYPRPNGYQALHTTVMSKEGDWVEVQIRTKRMDEVAEQGQAAHWKYKEGGEDKHTAELDALIGKLRGELEQQQE